LRDQHQQRPFSTDAAVTAYVEELTRRLARELDGALHAAYVIGSLALGDYVPGRSDIDILAVSTTAPSQARKQRMVDRLSHPTLRCPARGLELVLYERAAAAQLGVTPGFALNLNTGPRMRQHVSFEPSSEPAHWFILDIAIARARGLRLVGPPAGDVFAEIPDGRIRDALLESLDWHVDNETATHMSVLNACRSTASPNPREVRAFTRSVRARIAGLGG
jgi:Nucleotidyltransferase domain